jgi:uncharacterized protein YndB with AHSA1/START domain
MSANDQGAKPSTNPKSSRYGPERRNFIITRTFDAPRELIFNLWSDPNHLRRWWGPKGCTVGFCNMDLRPGGQLLYSLRTPDGNEMWGKFVYREILPPERIVFVNSFSDPQGNVTRSPFNPQWPLEILNTLNLGEQFNLTTLTLMGRPLNPTEAELQLFDSMLDSLHQGFSATFDQLSAYLATLSPK